MATGKIDKQQEPAESPEARYHAAATVLRDPDLALPAAVKDLLQGYAEREISVHRQRMAEAALMPGPRIEEFKKRHKLRYRRVAELITAYRESLDNQHPFTTGELWRVRRGIAGRKVCDAAAGFLSHCERHPEWLKRQLEDYRWSRALDDSAERAKALLEEGKKHLKKLNRI